MITLDDTRAAARIAARLRRTPVIAASNLQSPFADAEVTLFAARVGSTSAPIVTPSNPTI